MRDDTLLREYLKTLGWLPRPPESAAVLSELQTGLSDLGLALLRISSAGHEQNGLTRIARRIRSLRAAGAEFRPLEPVRVWLTGDSTTDFLAAAIEGSAARHGLVAEVKVSAFGQILQPLLTDDPQIKAFHPDAVLVVLNWHSLVDAAPVGDAEAAQASITDLLHTAISAAEAAARRFGARTFVTTIASSPERLFGAIDAKLAGTLQHATAAFNRELLALTGVRDPIGIDLARNAELLGISEWDPGRYWHHAKLPFAPHLTPLVAELCVRAIAAARGKSKRCLVMDLDNTLWGGVVGDDGIDGIRVGAGDPVGEAFAQVQRHAKRLKERGVVLAVSSKNNHEVALRAFRDKRGMVLTPEDIAVFQANWNDKAANVAAVADALDLGLQSLVFLDDNPMERARVRDALPEVSVPELPDDPADYSAALSMAGYFDVVSFSEEDRKRATFYEGNARRIELKQKLGDLGDFLRSLDMEIEIRPFARDSLARVVDLINKSNQFNLTTRRYTAPQVEAMCADAEVVTYQARLTDRFGDNGLISAVICRRDSDAWTIDSWIMSCRVLGREVERAMLNRIVEDARAAGAKQLSGVFLPSGRNDLVRDHYRKLGFELADARPDSVTSWRLSVTDYRPEALPIKFI